MDLWIRQYDKARNGGIPSEAWASSTKFDIQGMGWAAASKTPIPELGMNLGQSCSALKGSWKHYRILGREGGYRKDIAHRIRRLQSAIGLEKTQFNDYPDLEEESESNEESEEWWDLKSEENSEGIQPQTQEERELLEEEKQENDDWDLW